VNHWIEITTKIGCSSQCEYCPQDKLTRTYMKRSKEHMMSFETFEKCLSTVPTDIEVHFTGYCEPFLNPNAMDFIEHALAKGHNILINTTLKGMTHDDIDRLRKIIFVDRTWGGPVTVHLPCKEYKSNIVDSKYYDTLEYAIRQLTGIRFHAHGTPIDGIEDFIKSVDPRCWIKRRGIHSRAGNVEFKDISRLPKKFKCDRIWDNVLLPNGDLQLCCVDYGLEVTIGNLLESTYFEVHSTDRFKKILGEGTPLCAKCEL